MGELEYLYAVLRLPTLKSPESVVNVALSTLMMKVPSRYGYLEIVNEREPRATPCSHAVAAGNEHLDEIRRRVSHGVIGHARVAGRTVCVASATQDARFRDLDSVKQHELGAVLCVPFDGFWTRGCP